MGRVCWRWDPFAHCGTPRRPLLRPTFGALMLRRRPDPAEVVSIAMPQSSPITLALVKSFYCSPLEFSIV